MADKPLQVVAGRLTEVEAKVSSAGAGDSGKIVALDTAGKIDTSMMPTGVAADITIVNASENLAAGDFVNIWDSSGAKARKADATAAGKEAVGFVLGAVTSGAAASVYHEGANTSVSGLTVGARYYLSAASPGLPTATPPDAAGNVLQFLGHAVSATKLVFEGDEGIVQA